MKHCLRFLALLLVLALGVQPAAAQLVPCRSGRLDPRVAFVLPYVPDRTLAQERSTPVAEKRKQGPPNPHPVPEKQLERVNITADSLPVIVFRPTRPTNRRLPIIIEFHGGAFYLPLQPWMYPRSQALATEMGALVFTVDYRVAPEHKFPVPVLDCYNTFRWVLANAARYGGDTTKIMLSGESAGGNLAAVVSLLAQQEGLGKKIKLVSLFCPTVDNPLTASYPSYAENGQGYGITRSLGRWVVENYSANLARDTTDFRMFPIKATSLAGLPPTLVFTAEFDVLRDEGLAYANRLIKAGVPTHVRCFPGQLHVLMALPPEATEWKQMNEDIKGFMKRYL